MGTAASSGVRALPSMTIGARLSAATWVVLGVGLLTATWLVIASTGPWATTYAGRSSGALAAGLAAGAGLFTAALVWEQPYARSVRALAVLAAAAWLAQNWVGWRDGPDAVRSVAELVVMLLPALLVHLVVALPGAPVPRPSRQLVVAAYGSVAALVVAFAVARDPRLDPRCWSNCSDNVFLLVSSDSWTRALSTTVPLMTLALSAGAVAVAVVRISTMSAAARKRWGPPLAAGGLVGLAFAVHAAMLLQGPYEGPQVPRFAALYQVRGWALAAFAGALLWPRLQRRAVRRAVAKFAAYLGDVPGPGGIRDALALATGDTSVQIRYPVADPVRYVDHGGRGTTPPPEGQAVTPVRARDGRVVAAVAHDPATVSSAQLQQEIGPALRLALDNERLHAEILAELADLRAARARIVRAEDRERRALERNLHDGAQQRLLALSYDVRRLRASADGDPDLTPALDAALAQVQSAIGALRDLAHGIFPVLLAEEGFAAAVQALSERSPVPLEIGGLPPGRLPEDVERTAYLLVATAVARAGDLGRAVVRVSAVVDSALSVTVEGGPEDVADLLEDRVGALDGALQAHGDLVHMRLPCG